MTSPQAREHDSARPNELTAADVRHALAYGAFLVVGSIVSFKQVTNVLGTGSDNLYYGGVLFTILPILFVAGIVAAGIGIVLACVSWREWPLVVLAIATALLPAAARLGEQRGIPVTFGGVYIALFTLVSLLVPMRWFMTHRRRARAT